jgi:hydroxymethylbilane synthase
VSAAQTVRIATRSSELALRQARIVAGRLSQSGVVVELVTYKTAGDRNLTDPLSAIGAKGLFTRELEDDLASGAVDCCVHSLKDLPTEMPAGLVIGAILEREDPRDVLVVNHLVGANSLEALPPGSRVGTSSLRRRAQLRAMRADLEIVELRGNVPTRLRKVDEGQVHAAILAAAGLHRLEATQHISGYLDVPGWLPAPGQGAIAVQVRADDVRARRQIAPLDDARTSIQVRAERAFLGALEGGCQVPIGALGIVDSRVLYGFISTVDGAEQIRGSTDLDSTDPESCGVRLADDFMRRGAASILARLRTIDGAPAPQPE